MADKSELVFVPLGGVGEIGMNFALYGYGPANAREWIIIDCGVTFPTPELPGVDLVLPDTRFIEENVSSLRGMVITHAHEDHYGAVLDIWPRLGGVPVWMTPFTAGLLAAKRASEPGSPQVPVVIYKAGDRFTVGPFEISVMAAPGVELDDAELGQREIALGILDAQILPRLAVRVDGVEDAHGFGHARERVPLVEDVIGLA